MSNPDVVVIGAGLAGLTAAAVLSRSGLSVAVIEESKEVGGRLAGFARDGYRLDAGLHCFDFGDPKALETWRQRLGIEFESLSAPDRGFLLRGKDRLPFPTETQADPKAGSGFSEKETRRIKAWFELVNSAPAKDWLKSSLAEFIAESGLGDDELVKEFAGALGLTLLGRGRDEVSAGLAIGRAQAAGPPGFSVSTVAGGPPAIVEALAARLEAGRVKLCLGAMARSIEVRAERAVKVESSAEEYAPAAVVWTGPLQRLPDLVEGDGLESSFSRSLARLEPVAGVSIELGLRGRISELQGVMLDPAEAAIGRFPSNLDPSLAPEGGQLSSWLLLVPPSDLDDKRTIRTHINRLKKIIKRQFPDLFELARIERLRVIPIVASVAPTPKQALKKIPVRAKGAKNLYIAGDGVTDGGILSGAAVHSALAAADEIIKDLKRGADLDLVDAPGDDESPAGA